MQSNNHTTIVHNPGLVGWTGLRNLPSIAFCGTGFRNWIVSASAANWKIVNSALCFSLEFYVIIIGESQVSYSMEFHEGEIGELHERERGTP